MTTQIAIDTATVEEFSMRVAGERAFAANAVLVHLGDRLGLWRALAAVPSATAAELAERCGLAERYVQEWLAAQAAAGYVGYDAATAAFSLPVEHALVLADEESLACQLGSFELLVAQFAAVDQLAHAYTTGEGVGWHQHDSRLFGGVERFYGTIYRGSLLAEWIPAVDRLAERLTEGVRVLDVGCGLGTATIMLAEAFPASTFVGVDYHDESIRRATAAAEQAGVSDRVHFEVGDASSYDGSYDVIFFFDALHDLGDPVGALAHARSALAPGGQVIAVEPFAEDTLEANLENPIALAFYTGSATLCVPHSVADGGAAFGAQAGAARLTGAFVDAGFPIAQVAARTAYNLVLEAHR